MRQTVLEPLGMTHSAYEQPLSAARDRHAARAHGLEGQPMDAKWHVYARSSKPPGCGRPHPTSPGSSSKCSGRFGDGRTGSCRGRSHREMVNPVGVGDDAVGLGVSKFGEGW